MGFTVTYPGGTKDFEFQTYARLLRQSGIDLGNLPRVPEPNTKRKWLYVWPDREPAEAFRARLAEETGDPAWVVEEVTAPPTDGPLGHCWSSAPARAADSPSVFTRSAGN